MVKKKMFSSTEEFEKAFLPKHYKKKKEKLPEDPYELGVSLARDTMHKIREKYK